MYDSKPAALLVDVETWNQTIQRLTQGDQASASIRSGRYDTEEEVDAGSQVAHRIPWSASHWPENILSYKRAYRPVRRTPLPSTPFCGASGSHV
jgi:hypothetical protein